MCLFVGARSRPFTKGVDSLSSLRLSTILRRFRLARVTMVKAVSKRCTSHPCALCALEPPLLRCLLPCAAWSNTHHQCGPSSLCEQGRVGCGGRRKGRVDTGRGAHFGNYTALRNLFLPRLRAGAAQTGDDAGLTRPRLCSPIHLTWPMTLCLTCTDVS